MFRRKPNISVIVHHGENLVYRMNGRYLVADMKVSTRSKRGREIGREMAEAIVAEVGLTEEAFQLNLRMAENTEEMEVEIGDAKDGPALQSVPHPD